MVSDLFEPKLIIFFFQEFFNFLVGQAFATIKPYAHIGGFLKILLKVPKLQRVRR